MKFSYLLQIQGISTTCIVFVIVLGLITLLMIMYAVINEHPELKSYIAARWRDVKQSKPRRVGLILFVPFWLIMTVMIYFMSSDHRISAWVSLWTMGIVIIWGIFFSEKFNKINDYPGIIFDKFMGLLLIKFPKITGLFKFTKKVSDKLSEWVKENYEKFWLILLIPILFISAHSLRKTFSFPFLADKPLWQIALLQAVVLAVMTPIILFLNRKKIIRQICKEQKIFIGKKRILLGTTYKNATAKQIFQDLFGTWTAKYFTLKEVNAFCMGQRSFLDLNSGGVNIFLVKIHEEDPIKEMHPEKNLQIMIVEVIQGELSMRCNPFDNEYQFKGNGSCWVVYRPWF